QIRATLDGLAARVRPIAARLARCTSVFFVGRASGFPIALEGAQKLKEISYVHAEALPASELKHGPLALVTPETPPTAVLPQDALSERPVSPLEEIRARRGRIVAVPQEGVHAPPAAADEVLVVPGTHPVLSGILLALPLQLLAYECAVALGREIDQP